MECKFEVLFHIVWVQTHAIGFGHNSAPELSVFIHPKHVQVWQNGSNTNTCWNDFGHKYLNSPLIFIQVLIEDTLVINFGPSKQSTRKSQFKFQTCKNSNFCIEKAIHFDFDSKFILSHFTLEINFVMKSSLKTPH